jgi:hypothetical protein
MTSPLASEDELRNTVADLASQLDDNPALRKDLKRFTAGSVTSTSKPAWSSWI